MIDKVARGAMERDQRIALVGGREAEPVVEHHVERRPVRREVERWRDGRGAAGGVTELGVGHPVAVAVGPAVIFALLDQVELVERDALAQVVAAHVGAP